MSQSRQRVGRSFSSPSSDWDFLEDSKDVQRLWSQLPAAADVPFANILRWHRRQPRNQVTRRMHDLAQRLPLQSFEWSQYLDNDGRLVKEADFRLRVYHGGVSDDIRPTAWRHLLYVFPPHLTSDERILYLNQRRTDYFALRDAWKNQTERSETIQSLLGMIQNDVVRTDRMLACFSDDNSPYLASLYNILVTFSLNDPTVSYVQGMNDIASVLLRVFEGEEADTFIVFHSLMQCSKSLFTPDGLSLKCAHLKALLQRYDSVFFDYLCTTRSQDMFFCYRWLLLDMKREFDHGDVVRLFEVLWSTLPPPPHYLSGLQARKQASPVVADSTVSEISVPSPTPHVRSDRSGSDPESKSAKVAITVLDFGGSSASSGGEWAVIDCVTDSVAESKAEEVTAADAVDLEEAGEAISLSRSMETKPDASKPAISSSDWDVIDSNDDQKTVGSERSAGASHDEARNGTGGTKDAACNEARAATGGPVTTVRMHSDPLPVVPRSPRTPKRSDLLPVVPQSPQTSEHVVTEQGSEAASAVSGLTSNEPVASESFPMAVSESMYYGSPLTLFLCVAVMIEHRDLIMRGRIVEESIAIYFDRLRGRYDLSHMLDKARGLLASYAESDIRQPTSDFTDSGAAQE